MTNYGLVIDQERCIGCHACAVTCKQENNVGLGQYWNRVLTVGGDHLDTPTGEHPAENTEGDGGSLEMTHQPTACQHCANAPCVKVCPVNATYTRDDGIVEIDWDKCIGCRYCMAACPYNARVFNWDEPEHMPESGTGDLPKRPQGVVEKCSFCSHRVEEGLDPECVVNCPADARIFGDFDDPESTVSQYVDEYETHRLLEKKGTEPKTYYIKGEMSPGRPWKSDKLESELPEEKRENIQQQVESSSEEWVNEDKYPGTLPDESSKADDEEKSAEKDATEKDFKEEMEDSGAMPHVPRVGGGDR